MENETVPKEEVSEETTPVEETPIEEYKQKLATLEEENKGLIHYRDGYQGIQRSLNEKETLLKSQTDVRTEIDELKQIVKIQGMMQSEIAKYDTENITLDQRQSLVKQFDEKAKQLEVDMERKRTEADKKVKNDAYTNEAMALYDEAEKKFGDDIPKLAEMRNLIRADDMDLAKRMIAKVEIKEEKVETKETDDEIFERKAREKGLIPKDTVVPSGVSRSFEDTQAAYAKGDISHAEMLEAKSKEGIF